MTKQHYKYIAHFLVAAIILQVAYCLCVAGMFHTCGVLLGLSIGIPMVIFRYEDFKWDRHINKLLDKNSL